MNWLVAANFRRGIQANIIAHARDPEGFARMQDMCSSDPDVPRAAPSRTTYRTALILAAKGGTVSDITIADLVQLFEVEAATLVSAPGATHLSYRVLRTMNVFGAEAPATLRELRTLGQRTPEQMMDRYGLICQPIRDLLVDYLKDRQPALDYTSLDSLANFLGSLFWADLERHHPGIDTLYLPVEVADGWKRRLRTVPKTVRAADGSTTQIQVPRINYRECLTPVRACYLEARWAVEDPGRWAAWVAPCPIRTEEINRRKDKRQRKSRMDARTRDRLQVLSALRRSAERHRRDTAEVLDAARNTVIGATFTAAGRTLLRIDSPRGAAVKVWAQDDTGTRHDLVKEESHAFWTHAVIEVLRATGIRIEELTELSHHGLVQYRLPITGEIVPLLQIAQIIAGRRDINVTMGYKAVYPHEAIQAHLTFLARRRDQWPTDEYRAPSDEEWQEFLGHFERRKVSIGTCGRAFGSTCVHEHACVRCPFLWPDPTQQHRLLEIRDNLNARIAEAEREGWLGEVEGLQVSLAGAEDKLAQINRRTRHAKTTELGIPTVTTDS